MRSPDSHYPHRLLLGRNSKDIKTRPTARTFSCPRRGRAYSRRPGLRALLDQRSQIRGGAGGAAITHLREATVPSADSAPAWTESPTLFCPVSVIALFPPGSNNGSRHV